MAISIKTSEEIEKMRVAGRLAAEVLEMIEPYVKPGVSTGELDRICNDYIVNEQQAISACLGYHGFRNPSASLLMKWCATVSRTTKNC
jgi:methionyl aminopeptidase